MFDRDERIRKAEDLFFSGYNCAQSVAAAFADVMELDEKTVLRLASGIGGGLGGMRLTCGTVSAMCMVFGKAYGYDESDDLAGKRTLYAQEQLMGARFREEFGTLICRELLEKNNAPFSGIPMERTAEYYRKRPCVKYVKAAAGILTDMLNEQCE